MYNKREFNKINDKKVMHKVRKRWVVVSLALLGLLGGGALTTHADANADSTTNNNQNNLKDNINQNLQKQNNQTSTLVKQQPINTTNNSNNNQNNQIDTRNITKEANTLHSNIILGNANKLRSTNNSSTNNNDNGANSYTPNTNSDVEKIYNIKLNGINNTSNSIINSNQSHYSHDYQLYSKIFHNNIPSNIHKPSSPSNNPSNNNITPNKPSDVKPSDNNHPNKPNHTINISDDTNKIDEKANGIKSNITKEQSAFPTIYLSSDLNKDKDAVNSNVNNWNNIKSNPSSASNAFSSIASNLKSVSNVVVNLKSVANSNIADPLFRSFLLDDDYTGLDNINDKMYSDMAKHPKDKARVNKDKATISNANQKMNALAQKQTPPTNSDMSQASNAMSDAQSALSDANNITSTAPTSSGYNLNVSDISNIKHDIYTDVISMRKGNSDTNVRTSPISSDNDGKFSQLASMLMSKSASEIHEPKEPISVQILGPSSTSSDFILSPGETFIEHGIGGNKEDFNNPNDFLEQDELKLGMVHLDPKIWYGDVPFYIDLMSNVSNLKPGQDGYIGYNTHINCVNNFNVIPNPSDNSPYAQQELKDINADNHSDNSDNRSAVNRDIAWRLADSLKSRNNTMPGNHSMTMGLDLQSSGNGMLELRFAIGPTFKNVNGNGNGLNNNKVKKDELGLREIINLVKSKGKPLSFWQKKRLQWFGEDTGYNFNNGKIFHSDKESHAYLIGQIMGDMQGDNKGDVSSFDSALKSLDLTLKGDTISGQDITMQVHGSPRLTSDFTPDFDYNQFMPTFLTIQYKGKSYNIIPRTSIKEESVGVGLDFLKNKVESYREKKKNNFYYNFMTRHIDPYVKSGITESRKVTSKVKGIAKEITTWWSLYKKTHMSQKQIDDEEKADTGNANHTYIMTEGKTTRKNSSGGSPYVPN